MLALTTSPRSRNVNIEIVDDGSGISNEVQGHMFEPFFTTESTGTGLGLYIARELCEANSASLQYTNHQHANLEPGSVFMLSMKKVQHTGLAQQIS